jgi:hypothetical protein
MLATAAHYLPYKLLCNTEYLGMKAATYLHLGMKAATMMAPETPILHPLKSASIIEVSMVTGFLDDREWD